MPKKLRRLAKHWVELKNITLFSTIIFLACTTACAPKENLSDSSSEEILSIMNKQAEDWTRGDLEGFMEPYWKTDSLMFIGSKGVSYGWQKVLDNYQKTYPGPEGMGELVFDIVKIDPLSQEYVYVIGHWTLNLRENTLKGMYTLLWQNINGEWKIIADHSS